MPLPLDAPLLDACGDVVIRFKGHDQYGSEQAALKALARRARGSSEEECRAAFDILSKVYDRAVEAVRRHPAIRPGKHESYAKFEDIDFDACLAELDEIEPGEALPQKTQTLNWVIYWHYLK